MMNKWKFDWRSFLLGYIAAVAIVLAALAMVNI